MTATTTAPLAPTTLIIKGRDNWTESFLTRIEKAAGAKISAHRDDGAGNMTFWIDLGVRYPKTRRDTILIAVQEIAPGTRWA